MEKNNRLLNTKLLEKIGLNLNSEKSSKTIIWIFFILLIILIVFLFGWPLGIFGGKSAFPFGDDSPAHMALINFITENFPHINWYPNWYAGAMIQKYNPLAYLIWGIFDIVTGFTAETTIFFFTFISISFIALGIHGLVYEITKNRPSALIASLALITSAVFYGPLTLGATFARYFAVMFWMLSLWLLSRYIKNGGRGSYLGTVVLIACAVATNILIGALVVITAVLVLLFCSKTWKDRFLQIIKIGLPVAALLSFLIFPLIFTKSTSEFVAQMEHYPVPVSLEYLIITSTPAIFVCFVTFLANKIIKKENSQTDSISSGFQNALTLALIFIFIYGFTETQTLRFFSTYDAPWYFIIYLSIYSGILLGKFLTKINEKTHTLNKSTRSKIFFINTLKHKIPLRTKEIFLSSILLGLLILAPLQHITVSIVDPFSESWDSPQFIAEQLLKLDENETNFRFASDWIHIQRWFNFKYNSPMVEGAQGATNLSPYWYNWFEESIFLQPENYRETNFLLDWYAVKNFIIANKVWYNGGGDFYTRYGQLDKYLNRLDYYGVTSNLTVPNYSYWNGSVYQFEYKYATPILSANNVTTLLVIGSDNTYENIFHSLALSGYDSRFLIPIRGSTYVDNYKLNELKEFSIIYISEFNYHDYDKAWTILRQYVAEGGGLIIETDNNSMQSLPEPYPVTKISQLDKTTWNFTYDNTLANLWINPNFFSPPNIFFTSFENSIQPWAKTILRSHGSPILVIGDLGKGHVVWSGLNIVHSEVFHRNYMEASLLPALIEWITNSSKRISDTQVSNCESTQGWEIKNDTYPGAYTNLSTSNEQYVENSKSLKISYKFTETGNLTREWPRYTYTIPNYIDFSRQEYLSFWIYGDGSENELKFVILAPDWNNYRQLMFDITWNGWKRIVIPIDQMDLHGSPELSMVKKIEFFISNKMPTEYEKWSYLYIDDIRIALQNINYTTAPSNFNFNRPYPTEIKINVNTLCNGLLFKESYFADWHAYAIDTNQTEHVLQICPTGPDFIYIQIPNNLTFPLSINLKFEIGFIEITSYVISISTLVFMVVYGIWFNKIKLFVRGKKHKI